MSRRLTGTVIILCCLLATAPLSAQDDDTLRVLFIGNSHTYVNDLPGMFRSLSESGSRVAIVDMSAPGGHALMEHVVNPTTLSKIARLGWDFVALQEQSQIPTIEYWCENGMYPASRTLDSLIRLPGAGTAFYMTWGWKLGGTMTYREHSSPPFLWQADNCHATVKGTYLAACVFYAALWEADPRGLPYIAGLNPEDALSMQEAAWEAVAGVSESPLTPRPVLTAHAAPNPFSSRTRISYDLSAPAMVAATIFDATGRRVRALVDDYRKPGPQVILWNGRDQDGNRVRPGTYFCELRATGCVSRVRLVKTE
jgi:hypothetical protein